MKQGNKRFRLSLDIVHCMKYVIKMEFVKPLMPAVVFPSIVDFCFRELDFKFVGL